MMDFFESISSFFNKIVTYTQTLFTNIKESIAEMQTWIEYLPTGLIVSAAIIIVMLVIFRVLGR